MAQEQFSHESIFQWRLFFDLSTWRNSIFRCENYAITLLEQCENLEEVETFLQTKTHDGLQHKDANYILAILDSRKGFVAHERFQYVLLKKFGEIDLPVSKENDNLLSFALMSKLFWVFIFWKKVWGPLS